MTEETKSKKKAEENVEKTEESNESTTSEGKNEEVKTDSKIEKKKHERPKKTEAVVNAHSLHMSTKTAAAISRFIKGKKIQKAINELEEVVAIKKAIPMKGEFPHRKGKMMSGKYPQKAAKNFIKLLKSLSANANFLGIENPKISEAVSNIAPRPYGKFGAVRRKRTHVRLKTVEAKESMKKSKSQKNKKEIKK